MGDRSSSSRASYQAVAPRQRSRAGGAFPYHQFPVFDTVGALLWAAINVLLGYLGGHPLANNAIAALAPSFGVALAVADVVEFIRWLRRRQDRT